LWSLYNHYVCDWWLCMKSKLKGATELITKDLGNIYKILDKLEQRISSLEKVLASHAKCIGRLAHDKENRNEQS